MTATERIEPVAVDTVVTGEWIITLNAAREIYRDGAIAVSGGAIVEVAGSCRGSVPPAGMWFRYNEHQVMPDRG